MEWISYSLVLEITEDILARAKCCTIDPLSRRLLRVGKVKKKELWANGEYQYDTKDKEEKEKIFPRAWRDQPIDRAWSHGHPSTT